MSEPMSEFMRKVLAGESTTAEEWREHLRLAHAKAPSMSPQAFADCRNRDGQNSYDWLAASAAGIGASATIVDLACGDGFLVPVLQKHLSGTTAFVGIDLSEDELALARARGIANATFRRAAADATRMATATVDAVFCHMALMLMRPVEPVVREVERILKPRGLFTGVISGPTTEGGLFAKIQRVMGTFLHRSYPTMAKPEIGDARVSSEDGLRTLLNAFDAVEITDESFEAPLDRNGVWDHLKNLYILGGLPMEAQRELRRELDALWAVEERGTRGLVLDFPMRKFVATKR